MFQNSKTRAYAIRCGYCKGVIILTKIYLLVVALVIWNIIVFYMYGLDKRRARRRQRRISEITLITAAALMGGLGALFGVFALHHKTKHAKFKVGVPLLFILNIIVVVVVVLHLSFPLNL